MLSLKMVHFPKTCLKKDSHTCHILFCSYVFIHQWPLNLLSYTWKCLKGTAIPAKKLPYGVKFKIQNCKFYVKLSARNFEYFLIHCISSPMTIRFTLLLLKNYDKVIYTCYLIPYGVNYTFFLCITLYGGKVACVNDFIKYF